VARRSRPPAVRFAHKQCLTRQVTGTQYRELPRTPEFGIDLDLVRHPRVDNEDRNDRFAEDFLAPDSQPDHLTSCDGLLETRVREARIERAAGDFGDGCVRDSRVESLDMGLNVGLPMELTMGLNIALNMANVIGRSRAGTQPHAAGDEAQDVLESSGAGAVAETAHLV
jgi:hypothetical protein